MIPLQRNLIVLDLETTGVDPKTARIVEIGFLLVKPDGVEKAFQAFVNPGMPIPEEATKIHGITDADVKDARTFSSFAESLAQKLANIDIAGFNVRYDISVLENEFKRHQLEWAHSGAVLDGHRLWQVLEPRSLSDAAQHFLGRSHEGAHRADADVQMTWDILKEQINRLCMKTGRPVSVKGLQELLWPRPENAVDAAGKIVWINNVACLGSWSKKHGNKPLSQVPKDYLGWITDNDFPSDTKQIVRQALVGMFPKRAT